MSTGGAQRERLRKIREARAEDYLWLIDTGETNLERIALRLRFKSVVALKRFVERGGLPRPKSLQEEAA